MPRPPTLPVFLLSFSITSRILRSLSARHFPENFPSAEILGVISQHKKDPESQKPHARMLSCSSDVSPLHPRCFYLYGSCNLDPLRWLQTLMFCPEATPVERSLSKATTSDSVCRQSVPCHSNGLTDAQSALLSFLSSWLTWLSCPCMLVLTTSSKYCHPHHKATFRSF